MYPLVETIRIVKGVPQNLKWHQERYDRSFRTLFGKSPEIILKDKLNVPAEHKEGLVKCRFLYSADSVAAEFHKYIPLQVHSLKLVEDNYIEYSYKFTDRTSINNLLRMKGECDDILIVKNDFITDSSIANIVFYDGKRWITPADPLLKGTARERLLSGGKITTGKIRRMDLKDFSHFRLINAMLEFEKQVMNDISAIK